MNSRFTNVIHFEGLYKELEVETFKYIAYAINNHVVIWLLQNLRRFQKMGNINVPDRLHLAGAR